MKLENIQKQFVEYLYKDSYSISNHINSSFIDKKERLTIYYNNVFSAFKEVLSSIYQVTNNILGNKKFGTVSDLYVKKFYSFSGNIENYGEQFPKFIEDFSSNSFVYLHDLAILELEYHRLYFLENSQCLDIKKLQSLSQKQYFNLTFSLHPTCRIFDFIYPIFDIFYERKFSLENNYKEFLLLDRVFKRNLQKLSYVDFLFLKGVQNGSNIYEIYNLIKKTEYEFDIGELVKKFISLGIIVDFKVI